MANLGSYRKTKYTTGTRLDTSSGRGWKGVLAERWSHSAGDLGEVQVRDTEVIVLLQGRLHVRRRGDGQLQQCDAVPGTVWLCPNGVEEDMIRLYGEVEESLHIFLPALPLSQAVVRETGIDPDAVDLHYQGGFRDPLIEQIAWAIRAEMTEPGPAGKMLVETLAAALSVHLVRQYSNLAPASISLPTTRGALDPRSLRRVTDLIEARLGEDLTIEALAKEASLSPFHFARAFKRATGTTPHRYLTYRRIERGKALIAKGELPLAEVAEECGFSSQAHFTRRFKQFVGNTPGDYRRIAGDRPGRTVTPVEAAHDNRTVDLPTERHGDVLSMTFTGQIANAAAPAVREAVRNAINKTDRAVILDIGEHSSISDWGLQMICLIERELRSRDKKLVLCAPAVRVLDKFRGTGFEQFLSIHESKAQALASLEPEP